MTERNRVHFREILRQDIDLYAQASKDFNRIHLDEGFAQAAGLPTVIAHGMLSMGLAASALEHWGIDRSRIKSFSSRFKEKVFPGDKLVAEFVGQDGDHFRWRLLKESGEEVLSAEASLHPLR
jgi:acyl dehydratase